MDIFAINPHRMKHTNLFCVNSLYPLPLFSDFCLFDSFISSWHCNKDFYVNNLNL